MVLGIFGASGLGREILETVIEINEIENRYEQVIFVDDNPELDAVQEVKVYNINDAYITFKDDLILTLAVGEPATRRKIINRVNEMGIPFVTIIHPGVRIPKSTKIGRGCYVGPNSFVSCNVILGDFVLLQPNVNVGHDGVLADNVIVSGLTVLAGNVHIGEDTFVGMSCTVVQGCRIGEHSIVGMGSIVHRDIPDYVIAMGNPARAMKKNEKQSVFSKS